MIGAEQLGDALALRVVERHAAEVTVVGDPVVEPTRRLVEHQQLEVAQAGERGGVRHVGVQHATRLRHVPVQMRMEVPRRRIGVGARLLGIEQQQFARSHAGEVPAAGIEEELPAVVGHGDTEVVGDALVEIESGRPAERGRQVAAQRLEPRRLGHVGTDRMTSIFDTSVRHGTERTEAADSREQLACRRVVIARRDVRRGIAWAALSATAYSASAVLGKHLLDDLRANDLLFWRFSIAIPVCWLVLAVRHRRGGPNPLAVAAPATRRRRLPCSATCRGSGSWRSITSTPRSTSSWSTCTRRSSPPPRRCSGSGSRPRRGWRSASRSWGSRSRCRTCSRAPAAATRSAWC